jgi:hypothetical protein
MRRREFMALVLGALAGVLAASAHSGAQQLSPPGKPTPPPQPVP